MPKSIKSFLAMLNTETALRTVETAIKSMAELKTKLTKMIADAGVYQGLDYALSLNGVTYHSDTYETDSYKGVPEDGSLGFVRYINHSNNSGVFKMRAGRFYSKLIDETNIGQALPQQVKTWLCEEFSQEWQVYIAGTLPNYTLIVDHDFAEIYSGEACAPGMNSCMIDRNFHSFYRDSVKAKAARLVGDDGIILARCVIFTDVLDEEDKVWRLAERQYAKDQSDILKRALVDALIKAGEIDGFKQVGADCGSSRAFVDIEGNSLSHKKFRIECNLDWEDKLSYQDSFKYYNLDCNVAYNYTDSDYSYNLDSTNGELLDDDEETFYDEYHDYDCESITDVFYHGSEITCDCSFIANLLRNTTAVKVARRRLSSNTRRTTGIIAISIRNFMSKTTSLQPTMPGMRISVSMRPRP